ncbi:MAG: hypothetical protein LBK50_03630 [Candidatus Nomurabacteria bacterium]|jgi:hypothetical protein|nr:hypothetical protein [Candidatus Nomurabacteria bacterium]
MKPESTLKKDIIYIDVDDDITSTVGKIKDSNGELIELVPPKRPGFLQSAVSMKLIKRTAKKTDKEVAIVTADQSLLSLAAAAGIMVAKNLRVEPEYLTPIKNEADESDVINGEDLAVHEYAPQDDSKTDKTPEDKDIEVALRKASADADDDAKKAAQDSDKKVPNFNKFRKKLLIFGSIGVVVIAFLVWAIFFAAHATITISARTSGEKIQKPVALGDKMTTNSDAGTLKSLTKQVKKDAGADGAATGERDEGTKAVGKVDIISSDMQVCMSGAIPTGTAITLSGKTFIMTAGASLQAVSSSTCSASGINIEAKEKGDTYNISNGGGPVANYNATASGSTSGGTTKIVKVVTDADVRAARDRITGEPEESVKNELLRDLSSEYMVVEPSFTVAAGDPVASPAIGEATDGSGRFRLTVSTVYSITAVAKDELQTFLEKLMDEKASSLGRQKVYDYGVDSVTFATYTKDGDKQSATLFATGKIGPNIEADDVKRDMVGRKPMEVSENLKRVQGVTDVRTDLWPFWVTKVPKGDNRITVEFESEN